MKAVGYKVPGVIDRRDALQDIDMEVPKANGHDLLVKIEAVSVNPVDTKLRRAKKPAANEWSVLGFDASGVVEAVGPLVKSYKKGDAVYYAGSITRPGTNSEYHLVDERIVGNKPRSLNHAEAAALPLTTITAWEMLFDRLNIQNATVQGGNTILIIGGAGGVGSITIQLLRALTDMIIIASASRPETTQWVKECGAHYVVDHSKPLANQIKTLGIEAPGFVFSTTQTDQHFNDIIELIAPQGRFGFIDDPEALNIKGLKQKSVSLHWELMFTRSLFNTPDMAKQGQLLEKVATLVDEGRIRSTMTQIAGKINAATLRKVHKQIESGSTQGKIVLQGF